jgi:hypothetical protein
MMFHWCYVNDLHTTHAVVCWVTTETKPSSPSFISMHRAVAAGALLAEAVVTPTMPTRCSKLGMDGSIGRNHAAIAFLALGNTEAEVSALLEPSLDKPLQLCSTLTSVQGKGNYQETSKATLTTRQLANPPSMTMSDVTHSSDDDKFQQQLARVQATLEHVLGLPPTPPMEATTTATMMNQDLLVETTP